MRGSMLCSACRRSFGCQVPCPRERHGAAASAKTYALRKDRPRRTRQGLSWSREGGAGRASTDWTDGSTSTDRKSTRLNSSHGYISYAVFCLKKNQTPHSPLRRSSLHPPHIYTISLISNT